MESSLCSFSGFNIFGARAVFSMEACCLFPQHVLVVIPLIAVCRCGGWCLVLGILAAAGSSGTPLGHRMGAEKAHNHSRRLGGRQRGSITAPGVWASGSSGPQLFPGSGWGAVEALDRPWSPCRWCPALCELTHREKVYNLGLTPPLVHPPQTMATGL